MDYTAESAANYLAALGYTVSSRRIGGAHPPKADTIRRWCQRGRINARRVGYIWLIDQQELDQLVQEQPMLDLATIRRRNDGQPEGYWKATTATLCDEVERLRRPPDASLDNIRRMLDDGVPVPPWLVRGLVERLTP